MSDQAARLRWQCRRGMLELDAILLPFFEHYFNSLSPSEQTDFERLLTCNDQELFTWFIGSERPDDEKLFTLIEKIKQVRSELA